MSDLWNAKTYSQFLDLRTRPAIDLLAAIPDSFNPKTIYDLGCGPGNSTILLKNRWPEAKIIGLDLSEDMLQQAKSTYADINFIKANIADFSPSEKPDCLFANASLQWLDDHETLIPRLFKCLNTAGLLAIQMPNNFHSPSHQVTIRLLQNNSSWQPYLKTLRYGELNKPFYKLSKYYDLLITSGAQHIHLWETEYFQEMGNYEDIFNWVKGTGLRPVLSVMDSEAQHEFKKAYIEKISTEYPRQINHKILLPFKRIFMVCSN